MSVAIAIKSPLLNGKTGLVSHAMNAVNIEPAFNSSYVRWFATPALAQRYIDNYIMPGEAPQIVTKEEVLKSPGQYF